MRVSGLLFADYRTENCRERAVNEYVARNQGRRVGPIGVGLFS